MTIRRRAAYYSRAGSYSRSFNAESAEADGRLPRSRAAASLGLSTAAFAAGCRAAGYRATEWHHVGKFAARVDYYDCAALRGSPEFWRGAAASYKTAAKRAAVMALAAAAEADRIEERRREFRARLIAQRDCTRPVARHNSAGNWSALVCRRCAAAGHRGSAADLFARCGDLAALDAAIAQAVAADAGRRELLELLASGEQSTDALGRPITRIGGVAVMLHAGGVNIYGLPLGDGMGLSPAKALAKLRKLAARA